jgi:diaminohydroxyphosphoribosylaminopyrimidine deaminase/5-amino-6-(5-phosphoribosylamino)uracil reductase
MISENNRHELFMRRCFELAKLSHNKVKGNPNVGSVVVLEDTIISEGYYQYYGGLHAERNAILNVKEEDKYNLGNSTLYVSLEPCHIHGKTPPCTDIILASGIKKVVISATDPNPLIKGESIKLLKSNGIDVIENILPTEGQSLIKPFVATLNKRPYIIVKFAQSSDAYFGKRGKQVWLSGEAAKHKVHIWRSQTDAILVGYQTALIDNPKLTTRLVEGSSPLRIVLDDDLSLPNSHHLWADEYPTLFITQIKDQVQSNSLKSVVYIIKDENYQEAILDILFKMGIYRLIIEGGAQTLKYFIAKNLWDEARIIRSNKALVSGIRAPFINGKLYKKEKLEDDTLEYVYNTLTT